jgi:23S rRNA (guanine2445-N2)-methyltransferase / 23S rRNA (guanine2069-N7)-methyltransferase
MRDYFGFLKWRGHQPEVWASIVEDADERRKVGMKNLPLIVGSDMSAKALRTAEKNIANAGFADHIRVEKRAVRDIEPPAEATHQGLVVTNAPYGERLGTEDEAARVHEELGLVLKERFPGWKASVLTGSKALGQELRLRADKRYTIYNGPLECVLLNFSLHQNFMERR